MESIRPKYSKDEFLRRGEEIFQQEIAEKVRESDPDQIVAIDIDTADFEVGYDILETVDRLRKRRPEAQVWIRRVGPQPVMRFGGASRR